MSRGSLSGNGATPTYDVLRTKLNIFLLARNNQEYFYSPLAGLLVHGKVYTPSIKFARTYLYTWVEKDTVTVYGLPKNTTQCPQSGLEHGPLDPESSALTMRPPRLQIIIPF